jgi:hypothetical protein
LVSLDTNIIEIELLSSSTLISIIMMIRDELTSEQDLEVCMRGTGRILSQQSTGRGTIFGEDRVVFRIRGNSSADSICSESGVVRYWNHLSQKRIH